MKESKNVVADEGIIYLRMQEDFRQDLQCFEAAAKVTFDYD